MSQRDLTFNTPQLSISPGDSSNDIGSDSSDHHNPFVSPAEEEESSFESNQRSLTQSEDENSHYGKPFNAYNGYYSQNGTTSNLLSHENSSNDEKPNNNFINNNLNSSNTINVPPEYDRYPSMAGSRVVSSTSLSSHLYQQTQQQQRKSDEETSSISNKSSNPFLQSTDFSPFGGYPASSFPLHIDEKEPDDYLHNPDPIADAEYDKNRFMYDLKNLDKRSMGGIIGVILLFLAAIAVFIVLPALTYTGVANHYKAESYEILTRYSYPLLSAIRTDLVDSDTPDDALWRTSRNGDRWKLVFSDEFNAEGRTFYEGDDQFWTAPDINYAATKDLEWYDPDASSTANGTLNFRMDAFKNHDLFYRSGMVQSWNKLCFTQGILEVSARLPNYGNISGLWPGIWSMGNLGRPGYMGSTEGVWPYTYEACDAGITANQSSPDGISYLPGQRLNSCTCRGEDHPNPGVGRGAPEIDALEGAVDTTVKTGVASQSLQIAPFDIWYMPDYSFIEIHNKSVTTMNTYAGGPFQQAVSGTSTLNVTWYEMGDGRHDFQRYGFEYLNGDDDGYLTWYIGEEATLTVHAKALHPNGNIDWRRIPKEPLSLVLNLGLSNNWAYIDWPSVHFPVTMRVDYVRIYQPEDEINLTCDPDDYPTYDYIQSHLNIYQNVNLTRFEDGGYTFPRNRLVDGCST